MGWCRWDIDIGLGEWVVMMGQDCHFQEAWKQESIHCRTKTLLLDELAIHLTPASGSSTTSWTVNVFSPSEGEKDLLPDSKMTSIFNEGAQFQYIIRLLNTNIEGKTKIMYALTSIKGVGRRFANLVLKKADIDINKRYTPVT